MGGKSKKDISNIDPVKHLKLYLGEYYYGDLLYDIRTIESETKVYYKYIKKFTTKAAEYQKHLLKEFIRYRKNPVSSRILGYKDEPYQRNEKEMETPEYSYDELSEDEKIIYNENLTL